MSSESVRDRVLIRLDDPAPLVSVFSEVFQLPISWPITSPSSFTSGGVFAGNVDLEFVRFGPARDLDRSASSRSRLYGIAFAPHDWLAASLQELAQRAIPHSRVVPFATTGESGPRIRLFTNVFLGGLLGSNAWMKTLFLVTKLPGYAALAQARSVSPSNDGSVEKALLDRAFGNGILFLVTYEPVYDPAGTRAKNQVARRTRQGGALGVESVQEVVVGMKAIA